MVMAHHHAPPAFVPSVSAFYHPALWQRDQAGHMLRPKRLLWIVQRSGRAVAGHSDDNFLKSGNEAIFSDQDKHRTLIKDQMLLRIVTAAVKTPSLNPIRTESPSLGLCSSVTAKAPNGNSRIFVFAIFTMAT